MTHKLKLNKELCKDFLPLELLKVSFELLTPIVPTVSLLITLQVIKAVRPGSDVDTPIKKKKNKRLLFSDISPEIC